jgi:hypothetical protein
MKMLKTVLIVGAALALAGPASAQLVNGLPGPNYLHETPIGTKGGGSPASLQAPGEAAAIAGALDNEREAKNMQPVSRKMTETTRRKTAALIPNRVIARNDSFDRLKNGQE